MAEKWPQQKVGEKMAYTIFRGDRQLLWAIDEEKKEYTEIDKETMDKVVAIILARGGSKGIPKKNIVDFCGRPLIAWTIEQVMNAESVDSEPVDSKTKSPTLKVVK